MHDLTETRTPAGDRLWEAAIAVLNKATMTGHVWRGDGECRILDAAANSYNALSAPPTDRPRTTVEEFCSTAAGREALIERDVAERFAGIDKRKGWYNQAETITELVEIVREQARRLAALEGKCPT